MVTVSASGSVMRRNILDSLIETLRTELLETGRNFPCGDPARGVPGVYRRKGHATMRRCDVCPRILFRFIIDGAFVGRENADTAPGTDELEAGQLREQFHRTAQWLEILYRLLILHGVVR